MAVLLTSVCVGERERERERDLNLYLNFSLLLLLLCEENYPISTTLKKGIYLKIAYIR